MAGPKRGKKKKRVCVCVCFFLFSVTLLLRLIIPLTGCRQPVVLVLSIYNKNIDTVVRRQVSQCFVVPPIGPGGSIIAMGATRMYAY